MGFHVRPSNLVHGPIRVLVSAIPPPLIGFVQYYGIVIQVSRLLRSIMPSRRSGSYRTFGRVRSRGNTCARPILESRIRESWPRSKLYPVTDYPNSSVLEREPSIRLCSLRLIRIHRKGRRTELLQRPLEVLVGGAVIDALS